VEHPPATVTPSTAHAFLNIIHRLQGAGWRVAGRADNLNMEFPPGLTYDTIDLTRTANGVKASLSIQVFDDGLNADLNFTGSKKACGGH
jgi:hypothetical protein